MWGRAGVRFGRALWEDGEAAVDACEGAGFAEELEAFEDRWADGGAADGDADGLSDLAERELILFAIVLEGGVE